MSAEATLAARDLGVRRGRREVLAGVDIDLHPGETTAVLGPNGAGKSTLLAVLAGLLSPACGWVETRGRVASAAQAPALARRSVRANLELGMSWWGVPRAARRQRALAALAALGVEGLAERHAHTLSGGEARRVHLARVLAVEPDVLLLDEPFAGLDPSARADLLDDVAGVLRSSARSTCVVVHDRAEAWALADRVLVLLDGRVAAAGPPPQVLDRPPSIEVARFLGFSGELADGGEVVMARPGQVRLDPAGPLRGRVARRVPVEDGVRLEIELARGRLHALAPLPGPELGTEVGLRLEGAVRLPRR
ncbi:MAG TPA: ATP-binding cassette domain-containing protein [Solirubrobacterales bacterium]|nr:ATP-binding cassette domain-containing protein [Solirubrobacterales bacterium]